MIGGNDPVCGVFPSDQGFKSHYITSRKIHRGLEIIGQGIRIDGIYQVGGPSH